MASKKTILITNDDGIYAPGIKALAKALKPLGEIIICAPHQEQSGMGHAITIDRPIRLRREKTYEDVEAYSCTGTPVDSVKLAVSQILKKKADLCVSGINHGSNSSINVIYSGTMSAAIEAGIEGMPSFGVSFLNSDEDADLSLAAEIAHDVAKDLLNGKMNSTSVLNINVPDIPKKDFKGIRFCRQAKAKWEEAFLPRIDPMKRHYYWLTGEFKDLDGGEDTDQWALHNNYASVVPVQVDLTDYYTLEKLRAGYAES